MVKRFHLVRRKYQPSRLRALYSYNIKHVAKKRSAPPLLPDVDMEDERKEHAPPNHYLLMPKAGTLVPRSNDIRSFFDSQMSDKPHGQKRKSTNQKGSFKKVYKVRSKNQLQRHFSKDFLDWSFHTSHKSRRLNAPPDRSIVAFRKK